MYLQLIRVKMELLSLQSTRLVVLEEQEVKQVEREERISKIANCLVKQIIEETEEFFEELYKVLYIFNIISLFLNI